MGRKRKSFWTLGTISGFFSIAISVVAISISIRSCRQSDTANKIADNALKIQNLQYKKQFRPDFELSIYVDNWKDLLADTIIFPKDSLYYFKIANVGNSKGTLLKIELENTNIEPVVIEGLPKIIQPGYQIFVGTQIRNCKNCGNKMRSEMEKSYITLTYTDEIETIYKLHFIPIRTKINKKFSGFAKQGREAVDTIDATTTLFK